MKNLLVNIDHVATLRNARDEGVPDPVDAAQVAEEAGAAGIVFHLREDRRHIRDNDVLRLRRVVKGIFDFEMAPSDEMIEFCVHMKADYATLVPENREELTTEGGLNMKKVESDFRNRVFPPLKDAGVAISLFVDPEEEDIRTAARLGTEAIELHTGNYANAANQKEVAYELERLKKAAILAHNLGLRVNAGHGLNFENIERFLQYVPHLQDISIGHALISDALFNGLKNSVQRMVHIISR